MNSLDTGKDKIKKICEILETETLSPAKEEAARIVQDAERKAQMILTRAEQNAQALTERAKEKVEKEKQLFDQSMKQAFSGIKEQLRQQIEATLLKEAFVPWVTAHTSSPETAERLITALVEMIKEEGMEGDFSALISKKLKANEVNSLLGEAILKQLKEKSVEIGSFHGGVQLKLKGQHLTLDVSDTAIVELLVGYISKEFRDIIFQ